jgi:DDE superfamily endonuclease
LFVISGEFILVPTETKVRYKENGGVGRQFTTVVIGVNAKGDTLPPFTIYAAKNVNQQWTVAGPDGGVFKCSPSGWINETLFALWFVEIFLSAIQSVARSVLLLLDGHQCHFSVQVIEAAKRNDVIIVCLPPHCTHGLQTLDVVTFG